MANVANCRSLLFPFYYSIEIEKKKKNASKLWKNQMEIELFVCHRFHYHSLNGIYAIQQLSSTWNTWLHDDCRTYGANAVGHSNSHKRKFIAISGVNEIMANDLYRRLMRTFASKQIWLRQRELADQKIIYALAKWQRMRWNEIDIDFVLRQTSPLVQTCIHV